MPAGEALPLYRALLRLGRELRLTDRNYYFRRIRFEFEKNRLLVEPKEVQLQLDKAKNFLHRKALV